MPIVTTEDLLQYLYNETPKKKTKEIEAELEINESLREVFETMVSGQNQLEEVSFSPSDSVLRKINDYAEKAVSQLHPH